MLSDIFIADKLSFPFPVKREGHSILSAKTNVLPSPFQTLLFECWCWIFPSYASTTWYLITVHRIFDYLHWTSRDVWWQLMLFDLKPVAKELLQIRQLVFEIGRRVLLTVFWEWKEHFASMKGPFCFWKDLFLMSQNSSILRKLHLGHKQQTSHT